MEDLAKDRKNIHNRIKEIDKRLETLHPLWKEEERIKKEKERLHRTLRRLP